MQVENAFRHDAERQQAGKENYSRKNFTGEAGPATRWPCRTGEAMEDQAEIGYREMR